MTDASQAQYSERQEEELKVLESIYGDDFKDIRNDDKWKVPRPPEILLRLTPQESMSGIKEVHAFTSLRAKFPPNYPDSPPEISLEESKGLSDDVIKNLTENLKERAKDLVSEVMMLELAQIVEEKLHEYNRPTLSIYEENKKFKMEQLAKEKRKQEELQKKRQDYQRREIEQEINRRREEERNLRKENNKKREKSRERSESENQDAPGRAGFDLTQSPAVPVSVIEFNTKSLRQIYRGKCIDKGPSGCIVHIGIDKETGCPVALHEWIIRCPAKKNFLTNSEQAKVSKYIKAVKAVEQELHSLLKLSHVNLVNYLAMRYSEEVDHLQVDILQEFVTGTNLQLKIERKESVPLDVVRAIAEQLLTALDYLHSHSVVHKDLKATCVFLDTKGIVRLSDYSIGKRLADLYKESHVSQPGVTFTDDSIPARNSKKGDILKLGMLVFSLVQGHDVKQYPPDIPTKLPQTFQNFLNKCLAVEDRLRFTAAELLEHNFIKSTVATGPDYDLRNGMDLDAVPNSDDSDSDNPSERSPDATMYPIPGAWQLSRLHSEFKEMQWLGKGGFGDVVKVRNNLDGRFYAIKRILLDPRRSQFNKKITREVKLLSRLNHENVVRYYNSWIETLQSPEETSSDTNSSLTTGSKATDPSMNSLGLIDDIEKQAPPPAANSYSEWASVDNYSFNADADDEDDDEEDVFANLSRYESDEEESVLFEGESGEALVNDSSSASGQETVPTTTEPTTTDESSQNDQPKCYLYIQMEYCEKSTLREAIEGGLYDDKPRMWRLFRETLDGLVHVHEQGMIHRDLKPQNIFLDSNNHIKIGDFGLATSHNLGTATTASLLDIASSKSEGGDSGALTGRIGTALYVAPELNKVGSRTVYNQKVDMYSVGIIFFEMCYAGLQTKMERVKVLGNIRLEEIRFPSDWDEVGMQNEASVIRWCLTHKPEKRPTAAELLRSHLVPAPDLEKSHVVKSVRQALQDPHSGPHRLLMQELFNRPDNRKDDVFYDIDIHKGQFSSLQHLMQERVHAAVISILKRHGAVRVTPPLLAPRRRSRADDDQEEEDARREAIAAEADGPPAATFIDMSGTIVTLPYDLRVPFARYISRNGIYNLKRYAIEKVFRKVKIHRSHPKELWECAFDIVTPTVCNLIPDAEGISVVSEIISAFPVLVLRAYKVIVNHTVLLLAIFAHSGIPQDKYDDVKRVLTEAKTEKSNKAQLQTRFSDLPLTNQQVSTLCSFIDQQGPLAKIQTLLKPLTRNKQSPVSSLARQGLHELEALRKNLDAFGVKLPVEVHLGFVHNLHQYSGVIFQVSAEVRKQKKTFNEVLAAGGRYDDLVQRMALSHLNHTGVLKNHDSDGAHAIRKPHAFGVSIAVERIVSLSLAEYHSESKNVASSSLSMESVTSSPHPHLNQSPLSTVDVLVAVMGRSQLFHERIRILRELWEAGVHAEMTLEGEGTDADSLEVLQEVAVKRGISHLVVLKDKDNSLKVRSYDHIQGFTKQQEKCLNAEDLVDYLTKKIKEGDDGSSSTSRHNVDHSASSNLTSADTSQSSTGATSHHGTRQLNVEVVPPDKLAHNVKKRHESQVLSHLSQLPLLQHLSGKTEVYVVAVDLPGSVIKTLVLELELNQTEEEFNKSVAGAIAKLPKYKKYFAKITDLISDAKFHKELPLIILYSYKDDMYKLLS